MNTFGILDGGFVHQRVGIQARVALHDMQFVAMVVPSGVEPSGIAEACDVRHQRIALPVAARIAHRITKPLIMRASIQVDDTVRMNVLINDVHGAAVLEDLKRRWQIMRRAALRVGSILLPDRRSPDSRNSA